MRKTDKTFNLIPHMENGPLLNRKIKCLLQNFKTYPKHLSSLDFICHVNVIFLIVNILWGTALRNNEIYNCINI